MPVMPPVWSRSLLERDVAVAIDAFKEARIKEPMELYLDLFAQNRARVRHVLDVTDCLLSLKESVPALLEDGYYDVLRYLCAPPISVDDLHTVAQLSTKDAPNRLALPENATRIHSFVSRTLDVTRFPWMQERRQPTTGELQTALVATAVLMSSQHVQTLRRTLAKKNQEGAVKLYLQEHLHYKEVPTRAIATAFDAPKSYQFCGETPVAGKKADVVIGLGDNRFMCLECKVSNSEVNSFKRLNHETIEKSTHWYRAFGVNGVVCAGLLSGVFKVDNLLAAQEAGVSIFWSHDMSELGRFIRSTHGVSLELA